MTIRSSIEGLPTTCEALPLTACPFVDRVRDGNLFGGLETKHSNREPAAEVSEDSQEEATAVGCYVALKWQQLSAAYRVKT